MNNEITEETNNATPAATETQPQAQRNSKSNNPSVAIVSIVGVVFLVCIHEIISHNYSMNIDMNNKILSLTPPQKNEDNPECSQAA